MIATPETLIPTGVSATLRVMIRDGAGSVLLISVDICRLLKERILVNILAKVSVHTVTVYVRCTKGYIVKLFLVSIGMIVLNTLSSRADGCRADAEEDGQNHYQGNDFETNLS